MHDWTQNEGHRRWRWNLHNPLWKTDSGKLPVENFQISGIKPHCILVSEDARLIRRNQLVGDTAPLYLASEYRDDEIH